MNFENLLGLIIIVVLCVGSAVIFVWGLKLAGIIRFKRIDQRKWTKTTAYIKDIRLIKAKTIGKHQSQYEEYVQYTVVYKVDNVEYVKYIRGITNSSSRICIYYKNKNPNYFKTESEIKNNNVQKPLGFFLCIISSCIFIYGCIIMSAIIRHLF